MKNIQIIDGAKNCSYDVYQVSESDFDLIFPDKDQDIEFAEDLGERLSSIQLEYLSTKLWECRLDKKKIQGIHGTIFYGMEFKRKYYPNKQESDLE